MTNIREVLFNEFEKRVSKNSSYSLRSFAKNLEIDPSTLSKIMSGKKKVGTKLTSRIYAQLGICYSENLNENQMVGTVTKDYYAHSEDDFQYLRHWYYFAILEFLELDTDDKSSKAIAKALNLSINQVDAALHRMVRMGILSFCKNTQQYIDCSEGFSTTTQTPYTTQALRYMQKDILEKSIEALMEMPIEIRDHTSITVSSNLDLIKQAKEKIKNFRRDLAVFLSQAKTKDTVFQLSFSIFPLTNNSNINMQETKNEKN